MADVISLIAAKGGKCETVNRLGHVPDLSFDDPAEDFWIQAGVTRCFGFKVFIECPAVPSELRQPRKRWVDKLAYEASAKKLAGLFIENSRKYESDSDTQVKAASTVVQIKKHWNKRFWTVGRSRFSMGTF